MKKVYIMYPRGRYDLRRKTCKPWKRVLYRFLFWCEEMRRHLFSVSLLWRDLVVDIKYTNDY